MHRIVLSQLDLIQPADAAERAEWQTARDWVAAGAPLWRTAKPATPPRHLVSYFPVVDGDHILLVDHINAQRWLPPGGHVEPGEDPRTTVVRELREELGLAVTEADVPAPLMVTVTKTVGLTAGHEDVSLWYPIHRSRDEKLAFDAAEFHGVRWFHISEVTLDRSDPHLGQFIRKLAAVRAIRAP